MRFLAIALVLVAGGCKNLKLPDLSAYTPKVRFDRVDLGKADWNGVDTSFVLKVDNPNPVGVSLASWTWDLDVAGADSDSGGPNAGPEATPPFPGQDFVNPPLSLVGAAVVISVEPDPDNGAGPFSLKPLINGGASDVTAPTLQRLDNKSADSLARGQAILGH